VLERANAELKKLDKLKDEFISVASHELRSPIHPILGYASMARDGMIPSKEALDVIYAQAIRLKQLANDILDVSRIESGTLPYTMKKIGIHAVLLGCVEATRPSVNAGKVSLTTVVSPENEDLEIVGDRERLTQVFMNILGNAVKFTKKGRIIVETRLAAAGNKMEILFSDTGGGIPEEVLPKLFNKFVTKKVGEDVAHGTGLGLFICKAIVEAHGGKISAYNNGDGGATFRIELPLVVSDSRAQVAEKVAAREKRHTGS
jgi:signal transduction histidine kinase